MKKIANVLILVLVLLSLLTACTDSKNEAQNIIYENTTNNFNIELPNSWTGKYATVETENSVTFYNKANKDTGSGGELFAIEIWSKEKWNAEGEEVTKIIHMEKIGENNNNIFLLRTPTDVQYNLDNEKIKTEYNDMFNNIEKIKTTFQIKK